MPAGAAHAVSVSIQGHSPAAAEKSLFMLWRAASEAAGSTFFFAGASASPACKAKLGVGMVCVQGTLFCQTGSHVASSVGQRWLVHASKLGYLGSSVT